MIEVDWSRPWLAPLLDAAQAVPQTADRYQALNAAASAAGLRTDRGLPIRFVPQANLPADVPYEAFIAATGSVPTRDNPHDFFNALVWLTFPEIKARLNALQASEIARNPHASRRGNVRDAVTIFDENAALLVVREQALAEALRAHRWREAFVTHRAAFGSDCEVWLFGHALFEKLLKPYKAITAHAWMVMADSAFFALSVPDKRRWIDATVARQIAGGLRTADFTPLPVLGVPGWWAPQDDGFYGDETVFRPKRRVVSDGG